VTCNAAHLAGYKDWTTAVKVWYDEESMYDYSAGQFSHETGHFTAMVSNSSVLCCMLVVAQQEHAMAGLQSVGKLQALRSLHLRMTDLSVR